MSNLVSERDKLQMQVADLNARLQSANDRLMDIRSAYVHPTMNADDIVAINQIASKDDSVRLHVTLGVCKHLHEAKIQDLLSSKVEYCLLERFIHYVDEEASSFIHHYCISLAKKKENEWSSLTANLQQDNLRSQYTMPIEGFPSVMGEGDNMLINTTIFLDIIFVLRQLLPNHNPLEATLLHSKPNSLPQRFHSDYDRNVRSDSYVALYAIIDSSFWIAKEVNGTMSSQKVLLPANSLFLFKGTLCHAGDGFTEDNFRFHVYLDSKRSIRGRRSNRTYPVNTIWLMIIKNVNDESVMSTTNPLQ